MSINYDPHKNSNDFPVVANWVKLRSYIYIKKRMYGFNKTHFIQLNDHCLSKGGQGIHTCGPSCLSVIASFIIMPTQRWNAYVLVDRGTLKMAGILFDQSSGSHSAFIWLDNLLWNVSHFYSTLMKLIMLQQAMYCPTSITLQSGNILPVIGPHALNRTARQGRNVWIL